MGVAAPALRHRLGPARDPARNLPTVASQQAKDPITAAVTSSLRDKNAVLKAARSMVHVTSTASDGSRDFRCTGIIVGVVSDETGGKHARILTSSRTVCTLKGVLQDPKPKVCVCFLGDACSMSLQSIHVTVEFGYVQSIIPRLSFLDLKEPGYYLVIGGGETARGRTGDGAITLFDPGRLTMHRVAMAVKTITCKG